MLFIVSTPIGNLDDISIRQAKILSSSEIILAEDTRSAYVLIDAIKKRFQQIRFLEPRIISYYKEKEFEKLPQVIDLLKQGKNVALISESGTPLVSDPGFLLLKTCIKNSLPFTIIPGPSSAISAMVLSGFDPTQFMFLGFLHKKRNEKIKLFKKLQSIKKIYPELSFVFYESPLRVSDTLGCLKELKWNPDIVICREITKKFEEVIRGKLEKLINKEYKGEITVVLN